jgi:hypothetical protein
MPYGNNRTLNLTVEELQQLDKILTTPAKVRRDPNVAPKQVVTGMRTYIHGELPYMRKERLAKERRCKLQDDAHQRKWLRCPNCQRKMRSSEHRCRQND